MEEVGDRRGAARLAMSQWPEPRDCTGVANGGASGDFAAPGSRGRVKASNESTRSGVALLWPPPSMESERGSGRERGRAQPAGTENRPLSRNEKRGRLRQRGLSPVADRELAGGELPDDDADAVEAVRVALELARQRGAGR